MRLVARLAFALSVLALACGRALADDGPVKSGAMSNGWEFTEQGGADLFANVCAACHQPDAKGAVGAAAYPSLTGDKKLASTDFVLNVLFGGLRGMPPLGRMMSDEQVAEVVNYVRNNFGNSHPAAVSLDEVAAARRKVAPP